MRSEYPFRVRSYECAPNGHARMTSLCNYLQEAASMQAGALGFSKVDFDAHGTDISWVLTHLAVRLQRAPRWNEVVRIVTWPSGGRRILAYRDFELYVGDERIGCATSEWMLIDLGTRKLVPVPPAVCDAVDVQDGRAMPDFAFPKLRWDCQSIANGVPFQARRGDMDLNGHVNNVCYIEWLTEALPRAAETLTELDVAFKQETFAGENVFAEAAEVEPDVFVARICDAEGQGRILARMRVANMNA